MDNNPSLSKLLEYRISRLRREVQLLCLKIIELNELLGRINDRPVTPALIREVTLLLGPL